MNRLIEAKNVIETLMNKYRVVSSDEDLEWNRAIDYAIKVIEDEEKKMLKTTIAFLVAVAIVVWADWTK